MWLDPKHMSEYAYIYCRKVKDKPEIRKLITDSGWAYIYCKKVKNRPKV